MFEPAETSVPGRADGLSARINRQFAGAASVAAQKLRGRILSGFPTTTRSRR